MTGPEVDYLAHGAGDIGGGAGRPPRLDRATGRPGGPGPHPDADPWQYRGHPVLGIHNGVANEGMAARRGLTPYGGPVILGGRAKPPAAVAGLEA
ncbi:MAG: hypothetical protein GY929_18315 [Actinomycetia bacterium]|nr:hypothetical protein [Actinomycetes bacterium]